MTEKASNLPFDPEKLANAINRRRECEARWVHPWDPQYEKISVEETTRIAGAIKRRREHEKQWIRPWDDDTTSSPNK